MGQTLSSLFILILLGNRMHGNATPIMGERVFVLEVLQAIVGIPVGDEKENAVAGSQQAVALFHRAQSITLGAAHDGIQSALANNQIKGTVLKLQDLGNVGTDKLHGLCHFGVEMLVKVLRVLLFHLVNDGGAEIDIDNVPRPPILEHVGTKARVATTKNEDARLFAIGERVRLDVRLDTRGLR